MKPAFPGDERYERERPRDRGAFFNLEKLKSFAKKPDTWKLIALSMVLGLVITYAIVVHVSDSAELVPGNQTKKSGAKVRNAVSYLATVPSPNPPQPPS